MATNIILFMSAQDLKTTGYVDENVDDKTCNIAIREAQDIYILPLVGTGIYDDIIDGITNSNLSASYTTLKKSYIFPALKYYALATGVMMWNWKITNKAVMQKTSENSNPVTFDDAQKIIEFFKNTAEDYAERCTNYLIENSTTFTKYYNPGTGVDIIHPRTDNYSMGWVFNDNKSCRTKDEDESI